MNLTLINLDFKGEQMPVYLYVLLAVGIGVWVSPFFIARSEGQTLVRIDKRGRWGVALQCLPTRYSGRVDFGNNRRHGGVWRWHVLFVRSAALSHGPQRVSLWSSDLLSLDKRSVIPRPWTPPATFVWSERALGGRGADQLGVDPYNATA